MTWLDLINAALEDLGVKSATESLAPEDVALALVRLNSLIDGWNSEGMVAYQITTASKAMDGSDSYTVGSGGDINTTRPSYIEFAYWRSTDSIDYPLTVLDAKEWHTQIAQKTLSSIPTYFYWDGGNPLITVYLWPQPSDGTLYLGVRSQISQVSNTSSTIALPPAYIEALQYGLALRCGPAFRVQIRPELISLAAGAKYKIKRNNMRPVRATTDLVPVDRPDILTG